MKTILSFAVTLLIAVQPYAQIPISGSAFTYSQSFSFSSVPAGWAFFETGANADAALATSTGTNSAGNTYLLGTPSEYALGGLQSDNLVPTVGVCFSNDMTNQTITAITVQYLAETWRVGAPNRPDGLDFQINANTTSIDDGGGWTDVDALDYRNPGQAVGFSNVQHSATRTMTISGLHIEPRTTFCMRWLDLDAAGADDAIGVDNFMITAIATALPVELLRFSGKRDHAVIRLSFATATERNNAYFGIERSADARTFLEIGRVEGAGTSNLPHSYEFTDEKPLAGTNYYPLRQVDFDGVESFSPVVSVAFGSSGAITLAPSPAADHIRVWLEEPLPDDSRWQVFDHTGRQALSGIWGAETTAYELDVSALPPGMYTFRLTAGGLVRQFWTR